MARPKKSDIEKLTKEVKTMANRARVRMQELKKIASKQGLPYKTLKDIEQLEKSGLLTKSGNVSMKLPKTKKKLNIVKKRIEKFLEGTTTVKKVKKEIAKKPRKRKTIKTNTGKQQPPTPSTIQQPSNPATPPQTNQTNQPSFSYGGNGGFFNPYPTDETDNVDIGRYWQIARDYGLFDTVSYEEFEESINEIANNMSLEDFENYVYNFQYSMVDNDNPYLDDPTQIFFDTLGIDI